MYKYYYCDKNIRFHRILYRINENGETSFLHHNSHKWTKCNINFQTHPAKFTETTIYNYYQKRRKTNINKKYLQVISQLAFWEEIDV